MNSVVHSKHTKRIPTISKDEIILVSDLAIRCLEERADYSSIVSATQSLKWRTEDLYNVLGYLIKFIRVCLSARGEHLDEAKQVLCDAGFSGILVAGILDFVNDKKENIQRLLHCNVQFTDRIDSFTWRIDISLTNSVLKRAMSPAVVWNLTLNNEQQYTLQINIRTFHKIRFNVAVLLKEFDTLQRSSLLKK